MSIEQWSDLLFPEPGGKEAHRLGRVASVNDDGSCEVRLNTSSVTTRCANYCAANVSAGDRVLVLIMADGKTLVVGKRNG